MTRPTNRRTPLWVVGLMTVSYALTWTPSTAAAAAPTGGAFLPACSWPDGGRSAPSDPFVTPGDLTHASNELSPAESRWAAPCPRARTQDDLLLARYRQLTTVPTHLQQSTQPVSTSPRLFLPAVVQGPAFEHPFEIQIEGHLGGDVSAMTVAGSQVYFGVGRRLAVADVSNPRHIRVVGESGPMPGAAEDIFVLHGLAYIAAGWSGGIQVIDVRDPANPSIIGGIDLGMNGPAVGLHVNGEYAYVAAGLYGGLLVIDVSDPTRPRLARRIGTGALTESVAVSGRHAYVTVWNLDLRGEGSMGWLQVYDLRLPTVPELVAEMEWPTAARGLAVTNGHAYVPTMGEGLIVVDVTDPARPRETGRLALPSATQVTASGDNAYVSGSAASFVDIADPAHPKLLGRMDKACTHLDATSSRDHAVLASHKGLELLDIHRPASPKSIADWQAIGSISAVHVSGAQVLVTSPHLGLLLVDVSDPSSPNYERVQYIPRAISDITVDGTYAFVTTYPRGFHVADIGDRSSPRRVAWLDPPPATGPVELARGYALVAGGSAGLQVVDVQDPTRPRYAGYEMFNRPDAISIDGQYGYLLGKGLEIVDIDDPAHPRLVGRLPVEDTRQVVFALDGYVYATSLTDSLIVIDARQPSAPRIIKRMYFEKTPSDVHVCDGVMYAISAFDVQLFDVRDPSNPRALKSLSIAEGAHRVRAADGRVYIAADSGLIIARVSGGPTGR